MQRGTTRLIVALALLVGLTVGTANLASPSASAQSQGACVEPADESQEECPALPPETVQARPGTILLQESFDAPAGPLVGAVSRPPGLFDFAYVDGYLRARRLAEDGTAIMLLPYDADYDHATVAVSARLEGEVAGRYVLLGCRRQDAEFQTGYRLAVAPDTGLFTLVRRDAALEVALIGWQESGAIRRGTEWNRLQLTCAGSTIDAIVNGQVLASVQDETYRQGQAILGVGVFAGQGAPAEAYFDDLEVTRR